MGEGTAERLSEQAMLEMTANIIGAYTQRNSMAAEQLTEMIRLVHATLSDLRNGSHRQKAPEPAVPPHRSITPNHLICLEDGKKLKMLKRYLRTVHNMTPEEYRRKWGLRPDYPMVAPNYAKQRSAFAKKIGLGRSGGQRSASRS